MDSAVKAALSITERLTGIVQRVTHHNPDSGWSVLRVNPLDNPAAMETVIVHQTKVFAGATMEFHGAWVVDPRYGRQFKAQQALERKPASTAALEKYLGSGLIKGVGPITARKIVRHFGANTLDVFEKEIDRLTEVPGIAAGKLATIRTAWRQHRAVREVMLFLQGHGISTLFAVRIYKEYGDQAIELVRNDPYRLAIDFYGIGFFSADRVALSLGLAADSRPRLVAAIRHLLGAAREQGHCYLTGEQIERQVRDLLEIDVSAALASVLATMERENLLKTRRLPDEQAAARICYYAKSLYHDETTVADRLRSMVGIEAVEDRRVADWLSRFCRKEKIRLSSEQAAAVGGVVGHRFAILTGGPGCGKTTTTRVVVRLLEAMGRKVLLAAPTGRAAQRMSEVIGREAKTVHRLLAWRSGSFQKNEEEPLDVDVLIVDECSMLDISLTAALLRAVPVGAQLLFIGDADQLPSVGAGNVLRDLISSGVAAVFRLSTVFRQASKSLIITFSHQINHGEIPAISSPFKTPSIWRDGVDCMFIDSDELTREQESFIARVKRSFGWDIGQLEELSSGSDPYRFRTEEKVASSWERDFVVPEKFRHVDLEQLKQARERVEELKAVLRRIHPWSSLHYGLAALEVVVKLYREWIPRYHGAEMEIQVLAPMVRGTLGAANLNRVLQQAVNPPEPGKGDIQVGERIFRVGDRVIHRRNNYDLDVFNGDIGRVARIDHAEATMLVRFFPDGREVYYQTEQMVELDLAYAVTIHKSQGSEFPAVIIPVLNQHFMMLYRNLIYTGLTRARKLAVFVGSRKAMAMAVRRQETDRRQTALQELLRALC